MGEPPTELPGERSHMPLSRGLIAVLLALAVSVGSSLAITALAEEPNTAPQVADVVWDERPESVDELADDATVLVEAEVAAIEDGPDLVPPSPADPAAEAAMPTQRIVFETVEVLDGQIPATFRLFKTGSADLRLQGDPFYEVGQSYVLFLEPQGEPGTWIPAAPDGRLQLDSEGQVDPIIAGPVGEELEGQTPEQIEAEAQQ